MPVSLTTLQKDQAVYGQNVGVGNGPPSIQIMLKTEWVPDQIYRVV